MFVPRFPGIPETLYFPTPKAEENITSRGFREPRDKRSDIFPETVMLHFTRERSYPVRTPGV